MQIHISSVEYAEYAKNMQNMENQKPNAHTPPFLVWTGPDSVCIEVDRT